MRGNLGQSRLDVGVPAGPTGQDQGRGVVGVAEDADPGTHQVGDVLAGLQGPQEADVALALQAEGGGHTGPLGVVDRVEDGGVHAVVGDVEALGVAADISDGLVASGLGGNDKRVGPAHGPTDGAGEELLLEGRVSLGVGEEGGVVESDDYGHLVQGREGVVGRVQDVGADPVDEGRQPGLLPGQAGTARLHGLRDREEVGAGHLGGEVRHVPLLDDHGQVDAGGDELGHQVVDITPRASEICRDRRRIEKNLHGGRLPRRARPPRTLSA